MDAGNREIRGTGLFCQELAADIVHRGFLKRNCGVAALLGAIVHQTILTNVEITSTRAAAPLIGASLRNVVLEGVDPREAALLHGLHLVVHALLFLGERLQLSTAVVNDADS